MARPRFKWKKSTLAAAAAIALCLAATGTLAALAGRAGTDALAAGTAPGVSLHDDFAGGPEKDVYAENSGGEAMLTRIRLSELLELSNGELLPQGAADDDAGTGWHRHGASSGGVADCGFAGHQSFAWTLGGFKPYMPAAPSALAQGDYADRDSFVSPRDVGDTLTVIDYGALLRDAFSDQADSAALALLERWLGGDDTAAQPLQKAIAALPDSLTISGVLQYRGQSEEEQTRRLNEVRLTAIPSGVISMEEWDSGGRELGNFWVMDSDGWCYWARRLSAGEATGQLMRSCDYRLDAPAGLTYKIRAELDAVTTDPADINSYLTQNHSLGDITEGGVLLTLLSSGSYAYGADGEFYLPKGDNTNLRVLKNDGSYANYILGERICAGADGKSGNDDDLKPGQGIAVHRDGTLYRIPNADSAWAPDGNWAGPYQITEIVSGENGVAYLALSGGGYCCSVGSLDPASADYLRPATLGLGPYRLVWPGEDAVIGTADDLYNEDYAAVKIGETVRFYRRLSQKVYVRVAAPGSPDPALYLSEDGLFYLDRDGNYINESDLSPHEDMAGQRYTGKAAPIYYAAGERYADLESSTFCMEAMNGTDQAGTAPLTYNYLESYDFRFLLGTAFKFTQGGAYLFPADAGYDTSTAELHELTPNGVVQGEDGRFYLRAEVNEANPTLRWYIGPGADDVLGTADDERVKAGPDGLIGTGDDWGGVFTESFLTEQGKTPDNLTVGATFTTKGYEWVVAAVDGDGNRLVAVTKNVGDFQFGTDTVYAGSALESAHNGCPDYVPELKPMVQPVALPQNGCAAVTAEETSYVCAGFPLSAADYAKYKSVLDANWAGGNYSLRSSSSTGRVDIVQYDNTAKTGAVGSALPADKIPARPCMWVRLSDAAFISPHRAPPLDFLPTGFTGTAGESFTADGAAWVVLNNDGAGNLLIVAADNSFGTSPYDSTALTAGQTPPVYANSALKTYIDTDVMPKLTRLTPYIQPASFPDRGLSAYSADGVRTAFLLSPQDFDAYKGHGWLGRNVGEGSGEGAYWLRSGPASGNYSHCISAAGSDTQYSHWLVESALNCRPAMIVNFGSLDFELPYDFTGLPGDRLRADGYDWVVLTADASGNRLLMTTTAVSELGARSGSMYAAPAYAETLWVTEGRDTTFTGRLAGLLPYARSASIPSEDRYPYKAAWNSIAGGLSVCTGSAAGASVFVLSAGEYSRYLHRVPGMEKYCTATYPWALRSCYSTEGAPSKPGYAVSVTELGEPYDAYANTNYPPRMALWVNFG